MANNSKANMLQQKKKVPITSTIWTYLMRSHFGIAFQKTNNMSPPLSNVSWLRQYIQSSHILITQEGYAWVWMPKESHNTMFASYSSHQWSLTGEEWQPKWAWILQRSCQVSLAASSSSFSRIQLLFESCPPKASIKTKWKDSS